MKNEQQGFFVKFDSKYSGPFESLKKTRVDARSKGKNVPIYHGILTISETTVDDSKLFLIPKLQKV